MEKIPCTVGILTFNSGKTLERALESVKDFADILVCDGGSTDETLAIASHYGARVIRQNPAFQNSGGALTDYAGVRNQCLDSAQFDWFFYIDSDEEATTELVENIRATVAESAPAHLVYNISPRILLKGRRIEYSSNYPGWQKRFFNRKTGARFRKAVHERIDYDEQAYPVGTLRGHWLYEIGLKEDAAKTEKYARMDATLYRMNSWGAFTVFAVRKAGTICKIAVRFLLNRILHGSRALPFVVEWRRIRYQVKLTQYIFSDLVSNTLV
jgi:glycosyltransferase involved in cell wall biosynthesis